MKRFWVMLVIGLFLFSYANAFSSVVSQEDYFDSQSKSLKEDDCKIRNEGKEGKVTVVSYLYDYECLFLRGLKQIKDLTNRVTFLESRVLELEASVLVLKENDISKIQVENKKQDDALCSIKLFEWCLIK